jgi:Methylamine utilisation protein MauE
MTVLALTAKALVAVLLLVAGGAKLADLTGFAAAVRLLIPLRLPGSTARTAALAVAVAELALGLASLSSPATGWLNLAVLAVARGFVAVSVLGYAFHRGRSCRCFGALSPRRKFDALGMARAVVIAGAAGLATAGLPRAVVTIGTGDRILLLLTAALTSLAAFSAARALGLARGLGLEAP